MSGASLSHLLPPLPGFTALARTYAPWPVWRDSTTDLVKFIAMPKKAAIKLWHRARDFDRGTHQPGRHGGSVGHTALQVLHSLIFDFLNHSTGRLDPSYAAIARKAGVSPVRLKARGELARWQTALAVFEDRLRATAFRPQTASLSLLADAKTRSCL